MDRVALRLGASALLLRFLTHDGLGVLPRQPVSYWLCFAPPRLAEMYASSALREQRAASAMFDGDVTPWVWLACVAALVVSGGIRKDVLWGSRSAQLMSFLVFVLSPLCWLHRTYLSVQVGAESQAALSRGLPLHSRSGDQTELFDLHELMTNAHWHPLTLAANHTLVYKRAETHPSSLEFCSKGNPFALPGDAFFVDNRNDMATGVLKMDIYQPAALPAQPKPVVLHIHGGGWDKGDRSFLKLNYRGGFPRMLVDNGHVIASVAYRLSCTKIDGREMLADLRDAVDYVSENAQKWGGDGSRIILVGTSAGGNLALLTAYRQRLPNIIGVVSLYGVTELREEKLTQPRSGQSLFEQLTLTIFSRATRHVCSVSDEPDTCFSEMSPLAYLEAEYHNPQIDRPPIPPTLLIHGLEDPLVFLDQAEWLQQQLEQLGVPHALVKTTGSHDCDVLVSSPCGQATLKSFQHFLTFLEQI